MLFEDSTLWKAHVAASVAKYSLQVKDLVKSGEYIKAIKIELLVLDWDTAIAKYRLDQAIMEMVAITAKREEMRRCIPVAGIAHSGPEKVLTRDGKLFTADYPKILSSPKKPNEQTHPGSD